VAGLTFASFNPLILEHAVIRPIAGGDNAAIAAVIRGVLTEYKAAKPGTVYYDPTTDDLYHLFDTANAAYWIAEAEEQVLGGAGIYPTPGLPAGYCELVKLYLLPGARGRGLGKKLIRQCFDTAASFGYRYVYLETMPELHNALGLYQSCGFRYLQGPMGQSGHFGCDLWMVKDLQGE
jgi:putative acetyltransferase